jgi:hypothetical protein
MGEIPSTWRRGTMSEHELARSARAPRRPAGGLTTGDDFVVASAAEAANPLMASAFEALIARGHTDLLSG